MQRWVTTLGAVTGEWVVPGSAVFGVSAAVVGLATDQPAVSTCGAVSAAVATVLERRRALECEARVERLKERARDQRYRFDSEIADLRNYMRGLERQMWEYRIAADAQTAATASRMAELVQNAEQARLSLAQAQAQAQAPRRARFVASDASNPPSPQPIANVVNGPSATVNHPSPFVWKAPVSQDAGVTTATPAGPGGQYGPRWQGHPSGPIPVDNRAVQPTMAVPNSAQSQFAAPQLTHSAVGAGVGYVSSIPAVTRVPALGPAARPSSRFVN